MNRRHATLQLTRSDEGFTLIEIILVTVIIAVLAGMVTLSLRGTTRDAKIRAALSDISRYQTALDLFSLDHNEKYPKSLQELASGKKKYIKDVNKDPWGNEWVYLMPG